MDGDCRVYIFDIDGVLLYPDNSIRNIGINALKWALDHGRVYIVSGRSRRDVGVVYKLLKSVGVQVNHLSGIYMREPGDYRGELAVKLDYIMGVLSSEGCILEVHDDNTSVLNSVRRIVRGGVILHYNEYCEPLYGESTIPVCSSLWKSY